MIFYCYTFMHIISIFYVPLYVKAYKMNLIGEFVKPKRKQFGFTQEDLAENAGVALIGIRKSEQGKDNLSLTKVNHVLMLL